MKKIALYGKGGIGKTTVSSNLALTYSKAGYKVLLVGCDPKRDTTRLLSKRYLPTVIDNYNNLKNGNLQLDYVLSEVRKNLFCCEIGGPKPGVGCAGRGITIALDYLNSQKAFENKDIIIYDILGDVVCGGFATPIIKNYADEIYIVSSGEEASMFAANNICTGMKSLNKQIKGLIFNGRGFKHENEIIELFSKRINLDIVCKIPYDESIKLNEIFGVPITETDNSKIIELFHKMSNSIIEDNLNNDVLPIELDELHAFIYDCYKMLESE